MPESQGRHYLGRVRRVPHRTDTYRYASVEPLVESNPAASEWSGPVTDAQSRFPRRGLIHWHEVPGHVTVGSLWQFAIDEHPDANRGDRTELFQLADPLEPIEVIDLREWTDETALRSAITDVGIELTPSPLARRCLLWLPSGVCIGPLLLKPSSDALRWVLEAPEAHRDAARMPVWRVPPNSIGRVHLDGVRWFLTPSQDLGQSAGFQNWTPDGQVARSVLSRLRKMDPGVVKALGVVDTVFREYLERLEEGRFTGVDPAVERARADRLRGFRTAIERDVTLLGEAAEILLRSDRVRSELAQRVDAERSRLTEEMRREVEASLNALRGELARMEVEVPRRRSELAELEEVIEAKKREVEERVASFDEEVTSRLQKIAQRPEAVFAELAILRAALFPQVKTTDAEVAPLADSRRADRGWDRASPGRRIENMDALRGELGRRAISSRVSINAMLGLHAIFAAGATPVLIGNRAYQLLKAYSSAVSGSRLHWVPIGSSLLEPHDLFGRFDASAGRIVPHPAGLIDIVQDAAVSQQMHVVVLEGFNRAPIEAYLLPILHSAATARQGDSTRAIPIASSILLSESDPYRSASRVVWPPNVLLACVPAHGSATLPISVDAWRYLAVLDADDRERPPLDLSDDAGRSEAASDAAELDVVVWRTIIQAAVPDESLAGTDALQRLANTLGLNPSDANTTQSIYRVLRTIGLSENEALQISAASSLVPRSQLSEKLIEEALRSFAPPIVGWRAIRDEADRLRA